MKKWQIMDSRKTMSYGGMYESKEEAIKAAKERPSGFAAYLVTDGTGRFWNLDGERV